MVHIASQRWRRRMNINNRVYCYHEMVQGLVNPDRLLSQWATSWRNHGWEPRVLTRNDAYQHPLYKELRMRVVVYPSINPKGYDEACWLRWLAFDVVGGGVMSDYDAINVGLPPTHPLISQDAPVILEKARVPCVVAAGPAGATAIVASLFAPLKAKLGIHYSDMIHFQMSDWPAVDICREIMHPGWEVAPVIHFSRHGCRQYKPNTNKHDIIKMVTKIT